MGWNYRILAHEHNEDVYFIIHEVYYDENGIPNGYTENGVYVNGENIEDMRWSIEKMNECLEKPILSIKNFPDEWKKSKNLSQK